MSDKWHGGKGSKQIPTDSKYCDKKKFDTEWDRIFGKKKPEEKK